MDDKILLAFLDNAAEKALEEVKESGNINEKNAMTLILKVQFYYVDYPDEMPALDDEMDETFDRIVESLKKIKIMLKIGVVLAFLCLIDAIVEMVILLELFKS